MKKTASSNDSLIDHLQVSIFLVDVSREGTFSYAKINKILEKATGYSNEFLLGKSSIEAFGKDNGRGIEAHYRRCLEKGEPITYEEMLDFPAGKKSWLTKLSPIWKDGRIVQIAGVSTDITKTKEKEARLKELYQKTNTALNTGKLAWWEMELPSGQIWFDDRKAEMLGYSPKRFNHYEDFTKLVHPQDHKKTMEAMQDYLNGKKGLYETEYRIKNKSGDYTWFKDVGSIVEKDDKNGRLKIMGLVQDINDQKMIEKRLSEKKNLLRITFNSIGDAIITTDTKDTIMEMNPAAEQLTGWSIDSAIGKPFSEMIKLISPSTKECLNYPPHTILITKSGKSKQVTLSEMPIKDEEGKIYGTIRIFRDITEEQKMKERLELAMDTGEHGFWDYNLETNESYYSPGYFKMLGYQPDELPMKPETWPDLIHPEDRKEILPQIEADVLKSQPYQKEIRMRCKDGSYKWISVRGNTYNYDKSGKPYRVVGIHVDIDELKRKTEALKESHRMAKMGRWDYYHKTDDLQWSEGILEIFELDSGHSETNYPTFLKKVHPEDREEVDKAWTNSLIFKHPYNIEHRLLMDDGRIKWVKEFCYTDYNQEDVPHHSVGIMQDITEQKAMEMELRKSEAKFRKLFQMHSAVQMIIDPQTLRILDANKAAADFYGYTKTELKQMKIPQINILPAEEISEEMKKAQNNQRVYFQFKHKVASGEIRNVEIFSNQLEIDEKSVIHSIIHDITDKKKYESELIDAKHLAEAASIAKSEFLSTMSHELRTPLNGVIGFSEILKNTGLTEDQDHYIDTVLSSAKSLLVIISDILDYANIETKTFHMRPERTDLKGLINKTCSIIRHKATRKGLSFTVEIDENIAPSVEVDTGKLRHVLLNLLSNAIKFTEKGSIVVSVCLIEKQDHQDKILFKISDTGIGVKENEQEMIFEAFQQADMSNTRRFEGTGLGLTISSTLLQKMGSTLEFKSTYGKGSEFWFELLLPFDLEEDQQATNGDTVKKQETQRYENKKVLIAEDHQVNMKYVKTVIAKFSKNIQTLQAKDGKEAYKLFLEHNPDLILMDMIMPNIDGYQATTMIRNRDKTVPIIALTAKALQEDEEACLRAGINEYVTKPVSFEKLKELLKKYLR